MSRWKLTGCWALTNIPKINEIEAMRVVNMNGTDTKPPVIIPQSVLFTKERDSRQATDIQAKKKQNDTFEGGVIL